MATRSGNQVPPKTRGLRRVWNAFFYSLEGIGSTLKHEEAFRQEIVVGSILVPVAIVLPLDVTAKLLLIGSLFLVFIVELLNSAIEVAIDYISEYDHHFLAKRAKDMASGAVFVSLLNAGVIWAVLLWQNWLTIFQWGQALPGRLFG